MCLDDSLHALVKIWLIIIINNRFMVWGKIRGFFASPDTLNCATVTMHQIFFVY